MERGEKWKHETDGQAADVGEGAVPDGGSWRGLSLCLTEWGPAAWAQGTEVALREGQAGEALQGARTGIPRCLEARMLSSSSCPKSVVSKIHLFPSFHPCLLKLSLAAVSPLCPLLDRALLLPPNSVLQPVELGQNNSFNFAYITEQPWAGSEGRWVFNLTFVPL